MRLRVEHELVQIQHRILGEQQEEVFKRLRQQPRRLSVVEGGGDYGDVSDPRVPAAGDLGVPLQCRKGVPAVLAPFRVFGGPPEVEEGLDGLAVRVFVFFGGKDESSRVGFFSFSKRFFSH